MQNQLTTITSKEISGQSIKTGSGIQLSHQEMFPKEPFSEGNIHSQSVICIKELLKPTKGNRDMALLKITMALACKEFLL